MTVFVFLGVEIEWMNFFYNLVSVRCPQVGGEGAGVTVHSLRSEVLAHARHIAQEDRPRGWIRFGECHLRKIYQRDVAVPVEDVVGGQVAVNPLEG